MDDTIERLVQAAIDTLHHDTEEGDDSDKYEREVLKRKFYAILAPHRGANRSAAPSQS